MMSTKCQQCNCGGPNSTSKTPSIFLATMLVIQHITIEAVYLRNLAKNNLTNYRLYIFIACQKLKFKKRFIINCKKVGKIST